MGPVSSENKYTEVHFEYKTVSDRFLEAEIYRKHFMVLKCLFCQICFADISAPRYQSGMVLYSKRTYMCIRSHLVSLISFRDIKESVRWRDLFVVLKMGVFKLLI